MTLDRRSFLGGLAIPFLPGAVLAQGLADQGTGFAALLQQIGGLPGIAPQLIAAAQHEFETVYGARAANALVRTLGQAPLETGLAQADDDTRAQVRFLARLLYTGEVTRDGQTRALYYPWCLAWRAVSFATAPGLCEGPAFGHWASAPAGATTAEGAPT